MSRARAAANLIVVLALVALPAAMLAWLGPDGAIVAIATSALAWQLVTPRLLVDASGARPIDPARVTGDVKNLLDPLSIPPGALFVVDGEDGGDPKGGDPNDHAAIAIGLGRSRRILVTASLLGDGKDRLFLGVLAHEVAHLRRHHLVRRAALCLLWFGHALLIARLGVLPDLGATIFLGTYGIAGGILVIRWYERRTELEADRLAARAVGADGLVEFLLGLEAAEPEPRGWKGQIAALLATHPSPRERVAALSVETHAVG